MQRYDYVKTENNKLAYTIFLPNGYSADNKYPLILSLHGAGERGNGVEELDHCTNIGIGRYIKKDGMELDAVVLCPQCPKDRVWNHLIWDLKDLVDEIAVRYSVDENRMTVTGMSMGGFGTWEMALVFTDTFAAYAPICGGGMAWRTGVLKGKKIWAFHGDKDNVVDISNSIEMVNSARKYGADVRFTVFNGVAHGSWDPAYLETILIQWLLSQERE